MVNLIILPNSYVYLVELIIKYILYENNIENKIIDLS